MEEGNLRNTLIWTLCQLGLDYKLIQLKPAYPKISRNIPSAWNPGNDLKNLPHEGFICALRTSKNKARLSVALKF